MDAIVSISSFVALLVLFALVAVAAGAESRDGYAATRDRNLDAIRFR